MCATSASGTTQRSSVCRRFHPPQFPTGRSVDITVNPAYTVAWLGGEVRVSRDVAAYLRIDNLADASYESVLGYPGLPRAVVAGLRFNVSTRR